MRLKRFLPALMMSLFGAFVLSGCLNEDNKIPPNCYDGELNNGETELDCGGPNCPDCPPSCFNGIWDVFPEQGWVEEETDCGGPCVACPTCDDGILNQDEIAIDCGGLECDDCPPEAGDCTNGFIDGDETGIDCGGCCCPDCPETAGDCTNGVQDGDETGVDCGGSACPPCISSAISFISPEVGGLQYANVGLAGIDGNNVLTISGTGPNNTVITFVIPEPVSGFVPGINVTFNETTAPTQYAAFGQASTVYNTMGNGAEITMFFDELGSTPGSAISGTFEGEFNEAGTTDNITVVNGTFSVTLL